jgi:hypothetical protein
MSQDFGIPGALQPGNGMCPSHGSMINRNGAPYCLQCAAEAAKAVAQPVGVVDCADPGHEAMANIQALPASEPGASVSQPPRISRVDKVAPTDDNAIEKAIAILRTAPMPRDMKVFKQISKAIALLEKASAPTTQGEN